MKELLNTDYLELCVRNLDTMIAIFTQANVLDGISEIEDQAKEALIAARHDLLEELKERKYNGHTDHPDRPEKDDEEEAREAAFWRKVDAQGAIIL